ncbi:MAG: PilT/PilU family type 4a pilus ATPase [Sumerlaeia bacterium]
MTAKLEDFLSEATEAGASDIYFVAGAVPCISCDGGYYPMQTSKGLRIDPFTLEDFARQLMSVDQWEDFEREREANLSYMDPKIGRFRVSVYWQRGSIGIVMRRVSMSVPTMRQLGLPPVLREISLGDRGIVIVTGSTGSGKSTTMASLIDYRNHILPGHIVTIEDPVEYVFQHRRCIITQREVGIDTDSFHQAMRSSLRQAPEVICIGEMRDEESVRFAMHAAETGHLVMATLHSTNALLAVERIPGFYPGSAKEQIYLQMSLNLRAIICQRLVPRTNGGRVAAVEVLVNAPHISAMIRKGDMSELKEALQAENSYGIQSFDLALYRLVKQGQITLDDALNAADSADDLQMKFRGIGVTTGSEWTNLDDPWETIEGDFEVPQRISLASKFGSGLEITYSNEGVPPLSIDPERLKVPLARPRGRKERDTDRAPRPPAQRSQRNLQAMMDAASHGGGDTSPGEGAPPVSGRPAQPPRAPVNTPVQQFAVSLGAPPPPHGAENVPLPPRPQAPRNDPGAQPRPAMPPKPTGGSGPAPPPAAPQGPQQRPSTEIKYRIFDTPGGAPPGTTKGETNPSAQPPPPPPPPPARPPKRPLEDLDLDELD